MTTARDQIYGALRLIGQLAEGESASADTASDALDAMNQMIDSWSTERLSVFCTETQVFNWPPNVISRTLGPTGDFVGTRPILVDGSTYFWSPANNISFPIQLINQEMYNAIAVKTVTSTYPQVMYVSMTHPDIEMFVYPVPTSVLEFRIVSVQPLTQPANLSTTLAFPPGYLRAFKFNLACEIAAEFGVEPSSTVQRIAMISKRDLKRINNPMDVMSMPYTLVAKRGRFNIFTGYPQ